MFTRMWSFNALLTFLCRTNRMVYLLNLYHMEACSIPVALGGYVGAAPGFFGETKSVSVRVAYTAGVTVNSN